MKHKFFTQLFLLLSIISVPAWSASPSMFNYAGHVSVSGNVYEGNGFFRFALVNFDCTGAATANAANCRTIWSNDGNSTNGSEPGTAVELVISKGGFSVNLGDAAITNMSALSPNIMQQTLYLRTWFDDGNKGSEQLKPDHLLIPVPNAISSQVSENAIGFQQSWQNMLSNRSVNSVYRNDTGRPISVNISVTNGVSSIDYVDFDCQLNVGSGSPPGTVVNRLVSQISSLDTSEIMSLSAVIPANNYYQLSCSGNPGSRGSPITWSELR